MSRLLSAHLYKAILFALIALILHGVMPGRWMVLILVLFVGSRFFALTAEAMRKPVTGLPWEAPEEELTHRFDQLTPGHRAAHIAKFLPGPNTSAREWARAQFLNTQHSYVPPREKRELAAEAVGAVGFGLLLPADVALYTRDFVSLVTSQSWGGAAVAALCLLLYAWPHYRPNWAQSATCRILWWTLPFLPAYLLFVTGIRDHHPYLNPLRPDHAKLAAERVLALRNNVVAGRHADWVMHYARQLDGRGEAAQAAYYYREALRLDPSNRSAYARLATLEAKTSGISLARPTTASLVPSAPYWTAGQPLASSTRCRIDFQLETAEGCTIIVVPVGDISGEILDTVAHVVRSELNLPVCVSPEVVPLPPYTRVRGLVTGRQWDHAALITAFQRVHPKLPQGPIRFILITPVDIYSEGVNYVFSLSYGDFGALVSLARFGDPQTNREMLRHRAAKQTLCALIKSFKIPSSPNRDCVTSYTDSLEEFDAKGNHPSAETLAMFRRAVADLNGKWQAFKVRRADSTLNE